MNDLEGAEQARLGLLEALQFAQACASRAQERADVPMARRQGLLGLGDGVGHGALGFVETLRAHLH